MNVKVDNLGINHASNLVIVTPNYEIYRFLGYITVE